MHADCQPVRLIRSMVAEIRNRLPAEGLDGGGSWGVAVLGLVAHVVIILGICRYSRYSKFITIVSTQISPLHIGVQICP